MGAKWSAVEWIETIPADDRLQLDAVTPTEALAEIGAESGHWRLFSASGQPNNGSVNEDTLGFGRFFADSLWAKAAPIDIVYRLS